MLPLLCLFTLVLWLFALLIFFKAPTNLLWRISVAVTEFPLVFVGVSLLLAAIASWLHVVVLCSTNLFLAIIFTIPIMRGYWRGRTLASELQAAFPRREHSRHLTVPFQFKKMVLAWRELPVKKERHVYKTHDGENLELDFYAAHGTDAAPCVIAIHGGSWSSGDNQLLPELNSYLARRGYAVAAINYRLAPKYQSPAPVEDTRDALDYLTAHAKELNIDASRFVVLGRSAGGQVALLTGYEKNDPRICGLVSFYAPADLVWGASLRGYYWIMDVDAVFAAYLGGHISEYPERYAASSPTTYLRKDLPPTLFIHGSEDVLVAYEHSVRLQKKLKALGASHFFLNLPGATHACDYSLHGPSGQLSTYSVLHFLEVVTKGK